LEVCDEFLLRGCSADESDASFGEMEVGFMQKILWWNRSSIADCPMLMLAHMTVPKRPTPKRPCTQMAAPKHPAPKLIYII